MGVYFPCVNVEKRLMSSPYLSGLVYDVKRIKAYYPVGDVVDEWISMGGKTITSK